jgi:hypothetical protein
MAEDNIWLQGRRREATALEAIIAALQRHPDIEDQPGPAARRATTPAPRAVRGAGVAARTG